MRAFVLIIVLLFGSTANAQQQKEITNSIGMKLVLIHPGSFTMGSPEEEIGRQEDELPHEVTISKAFYLGVYEVNQDEYEKVIGKNPSHFKGRMLPVEQVSWDDAVSFCKKLSDLADEQTVGRKYRLPSEAEWEYACRASSSSACCFGDTLESLGESAWFKENAELKTHPVGLKKPNRWGSYDMHGNVNEWCKDPFNYYEPGAVTDPHGQRTAVEWKGTIRGGSSISFYSDYCRSATRSDVYPRYRNGSCGFRVVLTTAATGHLILNGETDAFPAASPTKTPAPAIKPSPKGDQIYLLDHANKTFVPVEKIELPERMYLKKTRMDDEYQSFITDRMGKLTNPERFFLSGTVVSGDRMGGAKNDTIC